MIGTHPASHADTTVGHDTRPYSGPLPVLSLASSSDPFSPLSHFGPYIPGDTSKRLPFGLRQGFQSTEPLVEVCGIPANYLQRDAFRIL